MLKIRFVFSFTILILITSACNAVMPTVESSTPTAIIAPTQTQPSRTATPSQKQPQVNLPQTADQVARVSLADAKNAYDNKLAIFVDARFKAEYETSHIKGALYFGDFELQAASPNFDKGQWIITYCT
jgi:3-mercaptopyruvate sulfurtransferase SseA